MIKSINYWTIGGFDCGKPVVQAMREAKDMGYEAIELCFGAGDLSAGVTEVKCREFVREAKAIGIKISSLCSGTYWDVSLSSPNKDVQDKAIAYTKEYLQVARRLEVDAVLVIPGVVDVGWNPAAPVVPYREVWINATKAIKRLIPTAKNLRVVMCIENVWNKFLLGPMEMKAFIDQFKSPYVGSYFDVGNVLITGYPEHWIEILGRRIKRVHLKNFQRQDAGGVLHGFGDDILQGSINWPAVVKALKKIKYNGFVTAEMIPFSRLPDLVLPDMDLARKTAGQLKTIFG
ncbi:MAG: sugar phosphate isomerase/epimerase family protein [Planctomycetota bacterium]